MRTLYLVLLMITSDLAAQTLYLNTIKLSHTASFQDIIATRNDIRTASEPQGQTDLYIALAYAYFSTYQNDSATTILHSLSPSTPTQRGAINEVLGLIDLTEQDFKAASTHFASAMQNYSSSNNKQKYYQAANNLAYTLIHTNPKNTQINILLDQIINHCYETQDTLLLPFAILNRASFSPNEAQQLLAPYLNQNFPTPLQSTSYFILGSAHRQVNTLKKALELSPYFDYRIPPPIKFNEKARIEIELGNLLIKTNPSEAIQLIHHALSDTSFLSPVITDNFYKVLSRAYSAISKHDSAAYYLLQIHARQDPRSDTLTTNIPLVLDQISNQGHKKKIYLWLSIFLAILFLILAYQLVRSYRRK